MHALLQDLRYAFRESLRRPGFNLLAVLTLALGIGAVTMMYSVIYNVLLNPFPYTDPRRMVDVIIRNTNDGSIRGGLAVPEFRAFVDESGVFEEAVGTNSTQMLYRSEDGVEQFAVAALTPNSFRFLGVSALLGRTFQEADATAGASPVGVVSYKVWITYFGGSPEVLGRTILLDNRPLTIVGVMPPRFTWNVADVWIPDPADRSDPDGMKKGFWLQARLKKGLSIFQAEAKLNMIGARLAQLYPDRYPKRYKITVITVIDWVVGRFRWVLYTLFGAVGLLLLIACCNVANMLLARATTRARELAIRSALGASRYRILQQSLVESLFLALGGGVLGIVLAYSGLRVLKQFIPPYTIAVETEIGINPSVLLFSLAVSMVTAVLSGVAPALQSTGRDVAVGLSASGKGTDLGTRHGGLRRALVVSEVTLSLVLLSGAAVLTQSFLSLVNRNPGFNPQNILATRMELPNASPSEKRLFLTTAVQRLAAVPGVVSTGLSTGLPLYGGAGTTIDVPGKLHAEQWNGQFELCNDTYFQVVGFRLISGSAITAADVSTGRKVAVVNETLSKRYFGNDDPVGKQIRVARLGAAPAGLSDPTFLIVGVVQDVRNRGLEEPVMPEAFIPYTVTGAGFPRIHVRSSGDVHSLVNVVRREVRAVNGNVVQRDPLILEDALVERSYARPRFSVMLMAVFGTLGLVLVGTGIYGLMAYVVSRQTREIGIRMALGAQRGQVFRSVFAGAFRLIGLGALLGAATSIATNRIIANQVWTVEMFDPIALGGAVALIAVLGAAACLHPAYRATRVDPALALRQD